MSSYVILMVSTRAGVLSSSPQVYTLCCAVTPIDLKFPADSDMSCNIKDQDNSGCYKMIHVPTD